MEEDTEVVLIISILQTMEMEIQEVQEEDLVGIVMDQLKQELQVQRGKVIMEEMLEVNIILVEEVELEQLELALQDNQMEELE